MENRASKARKPLRHKALLLHLFCQRTPKTVSNDMFETVFICEKSGELKPDLTTIARFAIQLSYPMSNLQHFLQARAGGLFVLVESVGVNVQRGGGLAVAMMSLK